MVADDDAEALKRSAGTLENAGFRSRLQRQTTTDPAQDEGPHRVTPR